MATYTSLDTSALRTFLAAYGIEPRAHGGFSHGIENSNFWLHDTQSREWVLTLFEHSPPEQIREQVALLTALNRAGLPVPKPVADINGNCVNRLQDRAALLCNRLPGEHIQTPSACDVEAIGRFLGRLHQQTCPDTLPGNAFGLRPWIIQTTLQLDNNIPTGRGEIIRKVINAATAIWPHLPKGIIHGDLFRDNALFHAGQLSGVVDFFNACRDCLLLDYAIAENDWCHLSGNPALATIMLKSYEQERPLEEIEKEQLPLVRAIAALRFYLSRLLIQHNNRLRSADARQKEKDPEPMWVLFAKHCRTIR